MVTPLYGQRNTVGRNNDIPMLGEQLTGKKPEGQNRILKNAFLWEAPYGN